MVRRIVPWLLVAGVVHAGGLPTHLEMGEVTLPIRVIDTPSGLRIVAEQDRSARRAAVVVVVDTGAADDPPGQEGLAHLVEHLGFRARVDGKHPFTDSLDLAGVGTWNAFTEHDLTTFYSLGATAALPASLRLEVARALDPLRGVDAATFDVEREVVRNELRQRDEQGTISAVGAELAAALYPTGHRYARPVIGTEASLSRLTLEAAREFVRERYQPHRMTLVVAGDLDLSQIGKLLEDNLPRTLLEDAPDGARVQGSRIATPPPVPDLPPGPRVRRIAGPADVPSLIIGWSLPQGFGKDGYLEQFAATVLEAFTSSAFDDDDVLALRTSLAREKSGSTLVLTVTLASGKNPEAAMDRVLDQVYRTWSGQGASGDSVTLARGHQLQLNRLARFAVVDLARTAESLLDRSLGRARFTHLIGDPTYLRSELKAIGSLGAGEIPSFSYRWFDRGRARAVYVEPLGVSESSAGSIPAVFSSSIQRVAVPPDALERHIVPPGAETRTFRLPTGLEVVLATRRSAPLVAVTLTSRGGRSDAEPLGSAELVQLGAWVRDRRDTFESSTGLLSSRWTERGARVFQFRAANGNLENALATLARTVESLEGGAPDTGYHFWHKERLTKLFALPRQRAERELLRALYGSSPLGRVADPAELERLPSDGPGAWNKRTLTPRNSVLVVSGDLVPTEAQAAVERQLGSWNRPGDPLGELPLPPGSEGAEPRIIKSARPGARLTEVTLACAVRIHSESERAAFEVLGEDIRSRLHQTARTSLGASYGFGAKIVLERAVGELRVTGDVDERGLVRVLALTRHEAGQLGAATLPADRFDLARWRQGIRTTAQLEHADTLGWAIGADRLSGLPADAREQYGATLGRLTPEDVTRAAAQCRRTAVVQLLGEPAVLDRAVQSTGG